MTLRARLDDNLRFDPEYAGGLANHLPMALVALQALGASDPRLDAFAARYAGKLALAPKGVDWPAGPTWSSQFGVPGAWPAYRSLFAQGLKQDGRDAVLSRTLPALMPGCGAAAFHGLIRTAHAVTSGHDGELADALAYWACRHRPIEVAAAEGETDEPEAVLASLRRVLGGWRAPGDLIVQRMHAATAQPAFATEVQRLRIGEGSLPALASLANRLYAAGGNFTVLHLVTGCHALRLLLPWLDRPLPAVRSFWLAYAAGAAGVPESALVPTARPAAAPDWPEIVARAVASDDEHVIKLVYSAREEHRHHGWAACREAAARAVATN